MTETPDFADTSMMTFEIPDMRCGLCVRSITEAVQAADPAATVQADLPSHRVQVHSALPREGLVKPLVESGYTPA